MNKVAGVVKGAPSGWLVSLGVHAAAFLLAGMLVVLKVVIPQETDPFQIIKDDRPVLTLKKLVAKPLKDAKPATSHIAIEVDRLEAPDLQLPAMTDSLGTGWGPQGIVGFNIIPDFEQEALIGTRGIKIGNELEVTLYDLKRRRNGRTSGIYETEGIQDAVEKFLRSGWNPSALSEYYRAPDTLYTPMIMVPPTDSSLGPWAFGEQDMDPWAYLLHYKGQLVHKEGIKFRFVVMGDNYLLIRVNGNVVMDYKNQFQAALDCPPCQPANYHLGHWYAYTSEWIELEPGKPQDVEFLLGDYKGYLFAGMVAVEEYGVEYPTCPLPLDNPQLPIFKTARLDADQIDAVYQQMWPGHLNVETGPVFSDFETGDAPADQTVQAVALQKLPIEKTELKTPQPATRLWTMADGKTVEADYVNRLGGRLLLRTPNGKMHKISPQQLSEADRTEVELLNPPKLKLAFKKDTRQFQVKSNPELDVPVPAGLEFAGGVTIEQTSKLDYERPLRVELYVIADTYDGDEYILFDRQIQTFTLTPENEHRFELFGRKGVMLRYEHYADNVRGEKYKGYMILVFNERNELVAQNLSHDWLLELRDRLLHFPVGRYFNRNGERVHPPRPIFTSKYWDAEA